MAEEAVVSPQPARALWQKYRDHFWSAADVAVSLDISRVRFQEGYLDRQTPAVTRALDAMAALEGGAAANVDTGSMVGHYWLRAPHLAPSAEIRTGIEQSIARVLDFARDVRAGIVTSPAGRFEHLIHIGVGGSTNGPQLICDAFRSVDDRIRVHFLDNCDPDGVARLMGELGEGLARTLTSVVSKSGITPTPCEVTAVVREVYEHRGLNFAERAIAITMPDTPLDLRARAERWLRRFELWDWVGGRTSATSCVGLLPAALQGVDVDLLLAGAARMDRHTRQRDQRQNPAVLLALMWLWLGRGRGERRMVILPYRDRLVLFPRHVQQLVMESIGKRLNRVGEVVEQGFTVYGNKGSSDQHSLVQQLRDGPADFFVTAIVVEQEAVCREGRTPGEQQLSDLLFASWQGTRDALFDRGRDSITIGVRNLDASSLGALLALYERAVSIYAELVNVNAYNQPGVDKHAASRVLSLQRSVIDVLDGLTKPQTAAEIARAIGEQDHVETVYKLLIRLSADPNRSVTGVAGDAPFEDRFMLSSEAG